MADVLGLRVRRSALRAVCLAVLDRLRRFRGVVLDAAPAHVLWVRLQLLRHVPTVDVLLLSVLDLWW